MRAPLAERDLDEKCYLLAQSPAIGRLRSECASNLRRFPIGHYLIFYRPIDDGIAVARVLRGSRDLESLFDEQL
jgi:toxin ParE1/3/4